MKICQVEDDVGFGRSLQLSLQDAGHEAVWLRSGHAAMKQLEEGDFDVLLVNVDLPDCAGLEVLRHTRKHLPSIPVLVLSRHQDLSRCLQAFDAGADDYLRQPFPMPELLARLRAVARRTWGANAIGGPVWRVRDLTLDERRMQATRGDRLLPLSRTEFSILRHLMRRAGQVVVRRELESRVLTTSAGPALDVHISNLRKKLAGPYIRTVRGVGYVLDGASPGS
ncbi:response regulator transcription factor [Oxalobacteraceae bacterium OM1]|nr:response regulator transcription factor [Oxalobacteraceae bacterium OM1]